ncbi:hypothetical protein JCM16138_16190 [Thermococcus atlanticus]
MALTPEEEKEFKELMNKLRYYGPESLTPVELQRLKYLLEKKEGMDPDLKLLALMAVGMLLGYMLAKGSK